MHRTISQGTRILIANDNVLTETTLGDFLNASDFLDDEEIAAIREALQQGLSYDRRGGSSPNFTLMLRR
jgi:hypothetical protein